ncbi:MAG: tetratricopeptide repeat protein [Halioglobus sp.]
MPPVHAIIIGLLLLSAGSSAYAHLPSLFGREYVRVLKSAAEEFPLPPDPNEMRLNSGATDPYQDQLEAMETAGGPYSENLAEPLAGLGALYQERGAYAKSIEAYRRALHVLRINDGLRSARQVPLLEKLIEVYRTVGDAESLDDVYHYSFEIHGEGHPPYTEEKVQMGLEYLQWQRDAYGVILGGRQQSQTRVMQAYLLNQEMLDTMAEALDFRIDWYRKLVKSQMLNLYLLLGEDPIETAQAVGMPSGPLRGAEFRSEGYIHERIGVMQKTGERVGRKLMQDLMARGADMESKDVATFHRELGDWYQWNGNLRKANEEYAIVESMLREAQELDLLAEWFAEPVELPDSLDLWRAHPRKKPRELGIITLKFDVSSRGTVKNVVVENPVEEFSGQASRVKSLLRDTHIRPSFSDGEPRDITGLVRRYRLLD